MNDKEEQHRKCQGKIVPYLFDLLDPTTHAILNLLQRLGAVGHGLVVLGGVHPGQVVTLTRLQLLLVGQALLSTCVQGDIP